MKPIVLNNTIETIQVCGLFPSVCNAVPSLNLACWCQPARVDFGALPFHIIEVPDTVPTPSRAAMCTGCRLLRPSRGAPDDHHPGRSTLLPTGSRSTLTPAQLTAGPCTGPHGCARGSQCSRLRRGDTRAAVDTPVAAAAASEVGHARRCRLRSTDTQPISCWQHLLPLA